MGPFILATRREVLLVPRFAKKGPSYSLPPFCSLGIPVAFLTPLRLRQKVFTQAIRMVLGREREEEREEEGKEGEKEGRRQREGEKWKELGSE